MHVGKERPHPSRDQSSKTHLVTGPTSTQRRQSGQSADWLRPRSSLRTCHEPAQMLWTDSGKAGFPMTSGRCGWKQGCWGTDDEDAYGSPEKWGQPPGYPSSCCPAVGPLWASGSFLASALLQGQPSLPMARGVGPPEAPAGTPPLFGDSDNLSHICLAPTTCQAPASTHPCE